MSKRLRRCSIPYTCPVSCINTWNTNIAVWIHQLRRSLHLRRLIMDRDGTEWIGLD